MKVYEIYKEQLIPYPIEKVFPFFDRPENLEILTPRNLKFRILTPSPIKMHPGSIIDYVIRIGLIPMRWTTAISDYDPPHRFVDVQLKGPYSLWHHTHTFKSVDGGTLITDHVRYGLPFGILGRIVHFLKVKRDVEKIFTYRKTLIEEKGDSLFKD
mgnify:CR=1 FL=1